MYLRLSLFHLYFWGIFLLDTGFSFNSFVFYFLFVFGTFFASQCFLTSIIYKQKYAVNHIFSYQCMLNCFSLDGFIQLSLSFKILTLWLDMEVFVFILLGVLWDSCICRLNWSNFEVYNYLALKISFLPIFFSALPGIPIMCMLECLRMSLMSLRLLIF